MNLELIMVLTTKLHGVDLDNATEYDPEHYNKMYNEHDNETYSDN